MVSLPWELIDKIISYTLDPSVRPYLFDIRLTKDIIIELGIKAVFRFIADGRRYNIPGMTNQPVNICIGRLLEYKLHFHNRWCGSARQELIYI